MVASKLYLYRVLDIGNQFKDCRKYEAANVVFAIALELSKHCEDVEYLVETYELNEINMEKNYFDLAIIKLQDQELNIPMPLLSRDAALAFMRIAKKYPGENISEKKYPVVLLNLQRYGMKYCTLLPSARSYIPPWMIATPSCGKHHVCWKRPCGLTRRLYGFLLERMNWP